MYHLKELSKRKISISRSKRNPCLNVKKHLNLLPYIQFLSDKKKNKEVIKLFFA